MINYTYEIVSSIIITFITIYFLNYIYEVIPSVRQELGSYRNKIIYTPLFFIFITLFVIKILDKILDEDAKIRNYLSYIKGWFIGLIIAYFGSNYWKINKILNIDNPIMLYIYSAIIYTILYGFVMEYIKYNI